LSIIVSLIMYSLECVHELKGHTEKVWDVKWSPDGKLLASSGSDRSIWIWGPQGGKWTCKSLLQDGHQRTIRKVGWSPCGNLLASASFDSTICIWDKRSGQFESCATLEGHENEVKAVSWSQSGNYIASCSRDKSVWIWSVAEDDDFECAGVMTSHSQDVKDVCWHPSEDVLASASYDDTIKIFVENNYEWESISTLPGHESTVWSLSWSANGSQLVSCSDDRTVRIWQNFKSDGFSKGCDPKDESAVWKNVCTLSGYHTRPVYSVDWNHQNNLIASAGGDNSIFIFKEDEEMSGGEMQHDPHQVNFQVACHQNNAHSQDVNAVVWNPQDPHVLASCSDDENIKIWRLKDL